MYSKILAAVNEYTNSETAARYALALARACGAKLVLVFASKEPADKEALRRAEAAMGRLFVEAQEAGVEAESLVLTGNPVKKILEVVDREGIDTVFAASRHEDTERRFFVRTVARELMVQLPCAAAVVRVAWMGKALPRNILVTLRGGRAFNEERAYFTAKLAEGFGAGVTLLHLPEPVTRFFHGEVRMTSAEREARIPADVREFAKSLENHGIRYAVMTARGKTSSAITVEAAQRKNDLILMGATQRGLITSIIKGNPVEDIMKSPPCNLLVFKPRRKT